MKLVSYSNENGIEELTVNIQCSRSNGFFSKRTYFVETHTYIKWGAFTWVNKNTGQEINKFRNVDDYNELNKWAFIGLNDLTKNKLAEL